VYVCVCIVGRLLAKLAEDWTAVQAVTSLDDDIFVLRADSHYVDVYDPDTLKRLRRVLIADLKDPTDITSSTRHLCVYIADYKGKVIFRLTADNKLSKWTVSDGPLGLSVTANDNLLVTCPTTHRLKEFTFDGRLVREIDIELNISSNNIWHAIELSPGEFAISHGGSTDKHHQVCTVNSLGQIGRCYGKLKGSNIGQLEYPIHLAMAEGSVLVACWKLGRVIQLSRTLSYEATILTRQDGLKGPNMMYYDAEMQWLYVADNAEDYLLDMVTGNVKVFQITADKPTSIPRGPLTS